jgi:aspartate kinase
MVVLKFGGTSVADRAALERLVAIIGRAGPAKTVVVSALGGATDRLLSVATQAAAGDEEGARVVVDELRARHLEMTTLVADPAARADVDQFLIQAFADLGRIVDALSVLRDVSPRWLDSVAAVGELCSSRLVAAVLSSRGVAATWVDARQVVVTDDRFTVAAPVMSATCARLTEVVGPVLASGRVPVIGGFVGASAAGVTTTLGRGGSDYSAAIVGACLDATEIQIWTDVDGMLTADPRIVSDARVVAALSFDEASELAYFGAKVLHPSTIQPAVAKDIPVRILNSRNAAAPGTLITASRASTGRPLTAVASKRRVTVVDIASTRMLMAHGFLHRLFGVFETYATSVDVVTTSEVSVSVTLDDTGRLPSILADLRTFADVTHESGLAVICAVGDGLSGDGRFVRELLQSLEPAPIRMLSQAAGRRNVTVVVPDEALPEALRRIHHTFFADESEGAVAP